MQLQPGLPNVWYECEPGKCTGEALYTVTAADFIHFSDPPREVVIRGRDEKGQFFTYRGPVPESGTYIPADHFKSVADEPADAPYPAMPMDLRPPCPECFWALTDSSWCSKCGWGCNIMPPEEKP